MKQLKLNENLQIAPGEINTGINSRIVLNDFKLFVSEWKSKEQYIEKINEGIGSSSGWLGLEYLDVMLFDKNGSFSLIEFYIPESEMEMNFKDLKVDNDKLEGSLVLSELCSFHLQPRKFRCTNFEKNILFAFSDLEISQDHLIELRITEFISLFFKDREYVAWAIHHPEQMLANTPFDRFDKVSSQFSKESFYRAFQLIEEGNFEELDKKSIPFLRELAELHNEIIKNDETRFNSNLTKLANWIYDVCERNYFGVDFEKYFMR
jgi:hypothetical protein